MTTPVATAATAPEAPPSRAPKDFPGWLPAMLVKELRRGLRTRGFVGALVVFQLVMMFAMLGTLVGDSITTPGARASAFAGLNAFFWVLMTLQLLVATPLRALGSLRSEIDSRSLDLLVLTRMSAWRIVLGKWISLLAQAFLLLVAMLPYAVVRYFGGSVDLVQDALHCAQLLAGCAVITAASLWASALPRGMQIVVPVAMVALIQMSGIVFRGGPAVFSSLGRVTPEIWWFDGSIVMIFFLAAAVRRIAPAADNHAPLLRGLVLLPMVGVFLCDGLSGPNLARGQFVFATFFFGLVCGIELATTRLPMRIHWERWAKRGPFGRLIGRFVLPGWPSALLFAAVGAVLAIASVFLPGLLPTGTALSQMIWLIVLGLCALATPIVVMELLPAAAAKSPAGIYILVFVGMSAFAAIAAGLAGGTWLDAFARVLPISSFWRTLADGDVATEIKFAQGGFGLVFLGIAGLQSRTYWRWVWSLNRQLRVERK